MKPTVTGGMRKVAMAAMMAMLVALLAPVAEAGSGWISTPGGPTYAWHGGGGNPCYWAPGPWLLGAAALGATAAILTSPYGPFSRPYPYPYPYAYPAHGTLPPVPVAVYVAPIQRQVCYPTGCYFLNGDGVTSAFQWVWVPVQMVPPPAPPPPQSAPVPQPPRAPPSQ